MATELITRTWCDVHLEAKDEHVEGVNYKHGGREIDLCDDCAGPFVEAARLVEEYGRREGGKQRKAASPVGGEACPECGKVYSGRTAVLGHARRAHDKGEAELYDVVTPFRCEECGREFSRTQGLAAHRKSHARAAARS